MERSSEISQEVLNVMIVQNAESIVKLNHAVFGNGQRGLDEIVRGMENSLSVLVEQNKQRVLEEKEDAKEKKKFYRSLLYTAITLGSGFLITFAVVMIRIYPTLEEMANHLVVSP